MNIPLGYEVGSGRAVSIPLKHMAVLGQTQESGKTTTQEAIIMRSGLRAIAFITKRGEKAFRISKPIKPFFREPRGDYSEYVISIFEGILDDVRLGWQERGWITKLCEDYEAKATKKENRYKHKAAKSFKDLMANVETALPHIRGVSETICLQLRKYLRIVIPEIDKAGFADKLQLHPGINVMDISRLSTGLQSLVIRSVIEWIHEKEKRTIVIIPEAWKFVAQSRSTPVKLAAIRFIREMAGLKNFLWLDSQDLRGVDKELLRSVGVWLFGVQREKNEVANTLDSIPDLPKPTAADIMRLGKGEFYAAYGTVCVRTYVRPHGMEEVHAQAIARGEESADSWTHIVRTLGDEDQNQSAERGSEPDTSPADQQSDLEQMGPSHSGTAMGDNQTGDLRDSSRKQNHSDQHSAGLQADRSSADRAEDRGEDDETMWKEKYYELKIEYDQLVQAHDALAERVQHLEVSGKNGAKSESSSIRGGASQLSSNIVLDANFRESLYSWIKERAAKDPGVLQLLREQPELRVEVKRPMLQADGATLRGGIALLITEKFFQSPQKGNTAFNELIRRGRRISKPNVYRECDNLAELGFLTKEDGAYKAVPGMKITITESR